MGTAGSRMAEVVERAVAVLRAGGLVAFPTETVYGLGADATNTQAVARVSAVRSRSSCSSSHALTGRRTQLATIDGSPTGPSAITSIVDPAGSVASEAQGNDGPTQ